MGSCCCCGKSKEDQQKTGKINVAKEESEEIKIISKNDIQVESLISNSKTNSSKVEKTSTLSKQLLINGKYSKDSFDRFGDDLCELLLSFLSISFRMCVKTVEIFVVWFFENILI